MKADVDLKGGGMTPNGPQQWDPEPLVGCVLAGASHIPSTGRRFVSLFYAVACCSYPHTVMSMILHYVFTQVIQ